MTSEFTNNAGREDFRIEEREGCVLAFGPIPLIEVSIIAGRFKKTEKAVIDIHLARLLGATLVCGVRENLDRLTQLTEPEAIARAEQEYQEYREHLSPEAMTWLAIGRQGTSSQALFLVTTGVRPVNLREPDRKNSPRDADDFNRCALLYEQVPEVRENLSKAYELGPDWGRMIDHWDDLLQIRQNNDLEGICTILHRRISDPDPPELSGTRENHGCP